LRKCSKNGHYKKDCRYKRVERGKTFDDVHFIEGNTSLQEGGDVYMVSSNMHADHDVSFINLGDCFHMTPNNEWFCEYEKYYGGEVFLGGDLKTKIIGQGKFIVAQ
jgi:hypothetical protein